MTEPVPKPETETPKEDPPSKESEEQAAAEALATKGASKYWPA